METSDEIIGRIRQSCKAQGLAYGHETPVRVSPGVWMFHATQLDEDCHRRGYCKESTHYAVDSSGDMKIDP